MPLWLSFPVVYAAVGVGGSQKGETFQVMDRGLIGPFDITAVSQYLWAYIRWAEEAEQGTGSRCFIFHPTSSCALRKMPRLPCLAHKAPVMQAKQQHSLRPLVIQIWN